MRVDQIVIVTTMSIEENKESFNRNINNMEKSPVELMKEMPSKQGNKTDNNQTIKDREIIVWMRKGYKIEKRRTGREELNTVKRKEKFAKHYTYRVSIYAKSKVGEDNYYENIYHIYIEL